MVVSIEWLNLVPRLRIGRCFEIRIRENYVICCNQVTKIICTRYRILSAFPAKSPCNLGSLAYFAISIFWEMNKKCIPDTTFLGCSESDSREVLVSRDTDTPSTRFSVKSSSHSGNFYRICIPIECNFDTREDINNHMTDSHSFD